MYILNSNDFFNFKVDKEMLANEFLKEKGFSSRLIRKSVREKLIFLNGKKLLENKKLKINNIISVKIPEESPNGLVEYKNLDILYEDKDVIAINKPPFMVTHTAKDDLNATLLNYVCGYFKQIGLNRKVRFVNRLDRDTSGIVIVAKNAYAHANISEQFEKEVTKKYLAIVDGILEKKEGIIEKPIARNIDGIRREVNYVLGKYAKTSYKVLREFNNMSLLDVELFTGRTHQIRVHLQSIGHPIVGDSLYNCKSEFINRQALHCYYMKIKKVRTHGNVEIYAKEPCDFEFLK